MSQKGAQDENQKRDHYHSRRRTPGRFYLRSIVNGFRGTNKDVLSIVKSVLLYGVETWILTKKTLKIQTVIILDG